MKTIKRLLSYILSWCIVCGLYKLVTHLSAEPFDIVMAFGLWLIIFAAKMSVRCLKANHHHCGCSCEHEEDEE
jgi:hypothetical protein